MKVVLKRNVPGLGKINEVKNVSDGYARNYLFPNHLAVPASDAELKATQDQAESHQAAESRRQERIQKMLEKLKQSPLRFKVKAGERGRLYGSITSSEVAEAIMRVVGSDFDKRWIMMERPIRDLGTHTIELKFHGGIRGQVQVIVIAETPSPAEG